MLDDCLPSSGARYAVTKVGTCPTGYSTSGDYCLASSDDTPVAVAKGGGCPTGFSTSGDYCLASSDSSAHSERTTPPAEPVAKVGTCPIISHQRTFFYHIV